MARPEATLQQMRIEVPCTRHGKPSYRWTNGYIVTNPLTGNELFPALRRTEAYQLVRELYGENVKVSIVTYNL